MKPTRDSRVAILTVAMLTVLFTASAQAIEIVWPEPGWPEIFEPNQLRTLNLEMDPCDLLNICADGYLDGDENDVDYELEVPAMFWMDGEEGLKIRVAVRQKSCDPIPLPGYTLPDPIEANNIDPNKIKISFKIDINQYYPEDPCAATIWHDLKKLSLENGDDVDVLAEGLGCNLHRMASGPEGYDYDAWRANWVVLYVNGVYYGVYINAEQIDKQFLRHRNIYISHNSWLYKYWGVGDFELKVGDDTNPKSPALEALCYEPLANTKQGSGLQPSGGICGRPGHIAVTQQLSQWINMQGMLAMAAINAFVANPDELFNHNNNAYFFDFNMLDVGETRKRMYFPWDQDSLMNSIDWDIYENVSDKRMYQQVILGDNPVFRAQYNQIMRDLLDGPLSEANINAFLDDVNTPELRAALAADLYNQFDSPGEAGVIERINQIKDWYSDRIDNVLAQVNEDEPPPTQGIVLLDDGFEGAVWDANWTNPGPWEKDTSTYHGGSASAHADKNYYGDFTCVGLDTNDAAVVNVDFWLMKNNISSYTAKFYYYNGTTYDEVNDIDALGADDEWIHYTDTITDSNYFDLNFHIKFSAALSGGGSGRDIWLDDVLITKNVPDNDGIPDETDNCPSVYNPDQNDIDGDGYGDICDNCPNTYNPTQPDMDGDGLGNVCDNCWKTNNNQSDIDSDDYGDICDNCPDVSNDQADIDADTHGNDCDNCPNTPNPGQEDVDFDDVGDDCDNCLNTYNPDQNDVDFDEVGTVCDNCPNTPNSDQKDADLDDVGNVCDNCPTTSNSDQTDSDIDGIGDECECDRANLDAINPVDFNDFAIVGNDWQKTGSGLAGDTNWNEVVDIGDVAQIVQHWLSNCPP